MTLVEYFAPFWGLRSTLVATLLLLFIQITQQPLSCQESRAQAECEAMFADIAGACQNRLAAS